MADLDEKLQRLLKENTQQLSLENYKKIKESDWWKLCKFPLLLLSIVLVGKLSPSESVALNINFLFFAAAWIEITMQIYRIDKKLDILYTIESIRSEKNEPSGQNINEKN